MESYLSSTHFDLVTPDGVISKISSQSEESISCEISITGISPAFVGFSIDESSISFNVKSTLAQIGINGTLTALTLEKKSRSAHLEVELQSLHLYGKELLPLLTVGTYVGKLFAADPRRLVQNPDYLMRMFGRADRNGLPLLSLGGGIGEENLKMEKIDGRLVAFLKLQNGTIQYDESFSGFLPTLAKALADPSMKTRKLLALHQKWMEGEEKVLNDSFLLVRTSPLHIRTAYARVVDQLLPEGVFHTSANVLQPDTKASGDIYELYGTNKENLTHIPLEFYTLEPHREHVFFADRDQLQSSLDDPSAVFKVFDTLPKDTSHRSAVFIMKGTQMRELSSKDWITRKIFTEAFPGLCDLQSQAQRVSEYIQQQPSYPFLKAIEDGLITSQGVLFSQYFPSPLMKKMLLEDLVQSSLKGIYFQTPSESYGDFFSHEDRTLLLDLAKFAIPVYWVDRTSGKVLQFAPKPEKDTGMFVPIHLFDEFVRSTSFGVYGSTLLELKFEEELSQILEGVLELKKTTRHPLLNNETPIALVTGGGPGLMEVGNRVARSLQILSCANIVDFRDSETVEQKQNPYIDAKMTYRLDRLVERQAEFNLDFPIIMMGGIGTDFEFTLEEIRRKIGVGEATPILLLGTLEFWRGKITARFKTNLKNGTIAGSEWVSNCFYCIENASEGLKVYERYFSNRLPIGNNAPMAEEGFHIAKDLP